MTSDGSTAEGYADRALRYLEFTLFPEGRGIHPAEEWIASHPEFTREHVLNVDLRPDDTVSVLYQLRGEIETARPAFDTEDRILDYNLSPADGSIYAYVHIDAPEPLADLLRIPRERNLIPDPPFDYTSDGGLRISVVGDFDAIRNGVAAVPDAYRLELQRTGDFTPEYRRLFDQLTERQQETLQAAVELGYYRQVRQASYDDIADAIDRTDGTVGAHLRNVEAFVMSEIVP